MTTPNRQKAESFQDTLFKVLVESPTNTPVVFLMDSQTSSVKILPLDMPKAEWRSHVLDAIRVIGADVAVIQSEVQGVFGEGADLALQARVAGADCLDGLPGVGLYLYSSLEVKGDPSIRSLFCLKPTGDNVYDPVQESYMTVMGDQGGADLMGLFSNKKHVRHSDDVPEYEN